MDITGKKVFYTAIENQLRPDGSFGILYDHYWDEEGQTVTAMDRAYAKLYTILAAAAVSGLPYHSGHLIRSDGIVIEGKVFDRRTEADPEEGTSNE